MSRLNLTLHNEKLCRQNSNEQISISCNKTLDVATNCKWLCMSVRLLLIINFRSLWDWQPSGNESWHCLQSSWFHSPTIYKELLSEAERLSSGQNKYWNPTLHIRKQKSLTTEIHWTASSEFGTYRLCEQQRFSRACASATEPSLLAHTSSESGGTFRQKARSLAPLNGWACGVKICHDGMLEDTNSLDGAPLI